MMTNVINNVKDFLGPELFGVVMNFARAVIILLLSVITVRAGKYIISKFFEKQKSFRYPIDGKKVDTMSSLLASIFKYAVYILAGIVILSDVMDLKSILAAAGIGGIAVGLGAQSLIKDIISGFFIVMEDQYAVGDRITIDNMTGTVEKLELRVTSLRDFNGDLYIIPNGEIKKVINHTRGNKAVIVNIPVAYSSDVNKAFDAAEKVCSIVAGEFTTITENPKVLGITDMNEFGIVITIFARTLPNEQWSVERRIRKLIKEEFDREKLEFWDRYKIMPDKDMAHGGEKGGRQI